MFIIDPYKFGGGTNNAPVASNVSLSGTTTQGQMLSGVYTYSDAEGNPEGVSTFRWLRSDDSNGTNKIAIVGATGSTYTLQASDVNHYIQFEVTPASTVGTSPGVPVQSGYSTIVSASNPSYDVDATAFLTAHAIANNSTVYAQGTPQQIEGASIWDAVDEFVKGMKTEGYWVNDTAYWIPLPDQTTVRNVKNPSQLVSFPNGVTFAADGLTFNGTNQYANTGIDGSSLTTNDTSLGVYMKDLTIVDGGGTEHGTYIGSNNTRIWAGAYGMNANIQGVVTNYYPAATTRGFVTATSGIFNSSNATLLFKNGAYVGAGNGTHGAGAGKIGIANALDGSGIPMGLYEQNTFYFAYAGASRSNANMVKMYDKVQLLQYRLKRVIDQRVVVDGDSNSTGMFTGNNDYAEGFPAQLEGLLTNKKVRTFGVGSAHASDVLSSHAPLYPGYLNAEGYYALMIGNNDFGNFKTDVQVYNDVVSISNYVKSLGCTRIVMVTYPPFGDHSGGANSHRLSYNQMLRDNAVAQGWKIADAATVITTWNTTDYANGTDQKHFSAVGCGKIAATIKDQINTF